MRGTEPPVFLYGTLLDPDVLARMSGRRGLMRRARPARLPGFARVRLRGTPYPTLVRSRGGSVGGLVLHVKGETLRRLSSYEGRAYRLCPVRVRMRRGTSHARAWMAPRWRAEAGTEWSPRAAM